MSQYQKGKTNLDFTEARDSEWQWHQLSYMQVCTSLQTDNHASTPPLSFLLAGCPSCRPTNSVKVLKALTFYSLVAKLFDRIASTARSFRGGLLLHTSQRSRLPICCSRALRKRLSRSRCRLVEAESHRLQEPWAPPGEYDGWATAAMPVVASITVATCYWCSVWFLGGAGWPRFSCVAAGYN